MGLISDFTGADENPLSEGGNWAQLSSSGTALQRLSSSAAATAASSSKSYWTPANFGPDLEAYVTVSTSTVSNSGILARIQGEGGADTFTGYSVEGRTTNFFGIRRWDSGAATVLVSTTSVAVNSGDKIGMRIEGSAIQGWKQASGSPDWQKILAAIDTTYPSAGKIGLMALSTVALLDDFNAVAYARTQRSLFDPGYLYWTKRKARRGRRFTTLAK